MYEVSFTFRDAERATGIPEDVLRKYSRLGELKTARIGRHRVVRRQALDEFQAKYEAVIEDVPMRGPQP